MTPREQQLEQAIREHKSKVTAVAFSTRACDQDLWCTLATPAPERTCDGATKPCVCGGQPKPAAPPKLTPEAIRECIARSGKDSAELVARLRQTFTAPDGVLLLDGAASADGSNTSVAPPCVCAETSARNCPEHSEPTQPAQAVQDQPAPKPADAVDHPSHYSAGGIEAIDVIEAYDLGFCLGNVVKYILRAGRKGSAIEDLAKARWYLDRYIEKRRIAAEKGGGK